MRKANVLFKDEKAGILTQQDDGSFSFYYLDDWITNDPVSYTHLDVYKRQGLNLGNVQGQIASYDFNKNLKDSVGGHHAIYLEGGVPSSKDAKYIPANNGFQILRCV